MQTAREINVVVHKDMVGSVLAAAEVKAATSAESKGVANAAGHEGGAAAGHEGGAAAGIAGNAAKGDFAKTAGKYALIGGGVLGAIWLLPQLMSDACNRSAKQMGMPQGSCSFISISGCCSVCILMVVMLMGMVGGGGGVGGGMF